MDGCQIISSLIDSTGWYNTVWLKNFSTVRLNKKIKIAIFVFNKGMTLWLL